MILDTNALSAYADGVPAVVAMVDAAPSVEVPVIALGEYAFGIEGSRRAVAYREWLVEFVEVSRVLTITKETAAQYAQARVELKLAGSPIPANDLWIAALARQHRLPILSRDRHFDSVKGIRRIGW
ncbi:MAG: type II toxin-antitoxin system VapC family toxin [Bryobacteraceae bacterium]